jgi:hypothetical protein
LARFRTSSCSSEICFLQLGGPAVTYGGVHGTRLELLRATADSLELLLGLRELSTGLFVGLDCGPYLSWDLCDLAESGLEIKVEDAKDRCLELLDGSLAACCLTHRGSPPQWCRVNGQG